MKSTRNFGLPPWLWNPHFLPSRTLVACRRSKCHAFWTRQVHQKSMDDHGLALKPMVTTGDPPFLECPEWNIEFPLEIPIVFSQHPHENLRWKSPFLVGSNSVCCWVDPFLVKSPSHILWIICICRIEIQWGLIEISPFWPGQIPHAVVADIFFAIMTSPSPQDTKMLRAGWSSGGHPVQRATASLSMLTEEKYGQSSGICWGCGGAITMTVTLITRTL